jgi:hypothetical protein
MWLMLLVVCVAGACGGIVNSINGGGFTLPRMQQADGGVRVFQPGFLGTAIVGAVAAGVSWGLYGSLANDIVIPAPAASSTTASGTDEKSAAGPDCGSDGKAPAATKTAAKAAPPAAGVPTRAPAPTTPKISEPAHGLTLAALVGAVLVGLGGGRWLTAEVDKKFLKATAVAAASAQPFNPRARDALARQIGVASPQEAFEIVHQARVQP